MTDEDDDYILIIVYTVIERQITSMNSLFLCINYNTISYVIDEFVLLLTKS